MKLKRIKYNNNLSTLSVNKVLLASFNIHCVHLLMPNINNMINKGCQISLGLGQLFISLNLQNNYIIQIMSNILKIWYK